ncbi:EAL domain-containing protein [Brumicola pallidula]|uniref:EAL domain-containing protein n=1 Tax=Brumicola pallidula TaxID=56807 RepID=UPI0002EC9392|nr:EAL domain-containing protein [Glaciecola pallidula]
MPIIGIGSTLTGLLKDADAACYMAKDSGRNRIHVYHIDDEGLTKRHGEMQWVNIIQQALTEDRFCLYAQSIESLNNSDKMHYELLVRMQDEEGNIIPPGAFLPSAERYNLIEQVDRWVIEKAFRVLEENPVFLNTVDFVSINLSGHSLTDASILDFIVSKFSQHRVDGSKICFEITETAAISHLLLAENFINNLKKFGCYFALDDFGSGLSSFGYLKNLSVDYLKIDGLFVKDMIEDRIDYAMVKSIHQIGHIMGMQTIAEFVESDDIKDMLKELGVDYAQGYAIHKPQPFQEILENI